jgi:hypothetical protein
MAKGGSPNSASSRHGDPPFELFSFSAFQLFSFSAFQLFSFSAFQLSINP